MFSDRSGSNAIEITDNEIRGTAPAVSAEAPMPGASSRYTFLPTGRILDAMRGEGWKPVEARQMGVRRLDHAGFQRHVIRFQRRDQVAEVGDYAPEVILLNSHDRSSGYQIHAGLFRWVCRNGMMVADSLIPSIHVRHNLGNLSLPIFKNLQDAMQGLLPLARCFGGLAQSITPLTKRRRRSSCCSFITRRNMSCHARDSNSRNWNAHCQTRDHVMSLSRA